MKIVVAGAGYVGLTTAVLLAKYHDVTIVDISSERVGLLNRQQAPFSEPMLAQLLRERAGNLRAVTDGTAAYGSADHVIVAVPTDYDLKTGRFDTTAIEHVVGDVIQANASAVIVIRSTVPIGYTRELRSKTGYPNILFSPEFLREDRAMDDTLHPSRIVVGTDLRDPLLTEAAQRFADLLQSCGQEAAETLVTGYQEAESIKLFSNTYLALRVCFINELDTFAELNGLDSAAMIRGVCLDPRIGEHYNNPSFGYGGYCLPKDTRQLLANYSNIPQALISAVISANQTRKDHIADRILSRIRTEDTPTVGIYRLTMKTASDNFRNSSVLSIMERLLRENIRIVIYEPQLCTEDTFLGCPVIGDLGRFKAVCSLILANRRSSDLDDVAEKVYSRDIFRRD